MPVLALAAAEIISMSLMTAFLIDVVVLSVAYSAYMMASMEIPKQQQQPDAMSRLQTVRSAVQPHRVVYGEVMTGGVLVYAQSHSINPETGLPVAGDNVFISLVVAFTAHQIEEIKEVWLNDKLSTDAVFSKGLIPAVPAEGYWGPGHVWVETKPAVPAHTGSYVHITKYLGTLEQAADPFLISLPSKPTNIITSSPTSGLNDLHVTDSAGNFYGTYSGTGMCVITLTVTAVGAYDMIRWSQTRYEGDGTTQDEVAWGTFAIAGSINAPQPIVDGIAVKFDSASGHSVGQAWEIRAFDGAPWTADCKLTGRSYVVVTLENNTKAFPNGLPNIKARIRGNNQVYDPRTGALGYSDNWALCVRDYLVKPYGLNCPDSDINDTVAIAAANACDEMIALANGAQQKRYTINGSFTVDKTPTAIMNEILATAFGAITWTQGQYRILPAIYYPPDPSFHGLNPSVPGLTESDLRGPIKVRPIPSMKDRFNTVTGTFISTETWQAVNFPKVTNDLYVSQDAGVEIPRDIQLTYITDIVQAQRVAKIMLERSRQGITVDFPAKWSAFPLAVGDTVPISIAMLGWVQKIFTVTDWKLNPEGGVDLQLQEEAAGCYDWNSGMETTVDLAQNTILPDPRYVPIPTRFAVGEELYATNVDSIIKSRAILTWDDMGGAVSQYEISYISPGNTIVASLPRTSSNTVTLDDTTPGPYTFKLRAMNYLGAWSDYAVINYTILGKSAPPSDVTGFNASIARGQMLINWNPVPDFDAYGYEIQIGTVWDAPGNTKLVSNYTGTSYPWTPTTTGDVRLMIKAIDTTGNYSTHATSLTHSIRPPAAVTNLTQSIVDNIVQLHWTASVPGSFPIDHYELLKGTDFATAEPIGQMYGTFALVSESVGGTSKYWIRAVDVSGLVSAEAGVYATVDQPPDYVLIDSQYFVLPNCSLTNVIVENDEALLPVNTSETFEQHFTNRGWNAAQDQVTAGFPIYVQPGAATALIEKVVDYGTMIGQTMLTMNVTRTDISGTVTFTPEILVSPDGVTYTSLGNNYKVSASAFRYAKYRLVAETTDGGLSSIQGINAVLSVKQKTYTGNTLNISDTAGDGTQFTFASFNINPVAVVGITAEAPWTNNATNDPIKVLVNFAGGSNPTSFKLLAWNKSGTRVAVNGVTVTIRYI